jgi:hypothetical protein
MKRKAKTKPFPLRLKLSQKRCASTPLDYGALKMASRVEMNGAKNAPPLTPFSTRYPRLSFFSLTGAVVVIDGMTDEVGNMVETFLAK